MRDIIKTVSVPADGLPDISELIRVARENESRAAFAARGDGTTFRIAFWRSFFPVENQFQGE